VRAPGRSPAGSTGPTERSGHCPARTEAAAKAASAPSAIPCAAASPRANLAGPRPRRLQLGRLSRAVNGGHQPRDQPPGRSPRLGADDYRAHLLSPADANHLQAADRDGRAPSAIQVFLGHHPDDRLQVRPGPQPGAVCPAGLYAVPGTSVLAPPPTDEPPHLPPASLAPSPHCLNRSSDPPNPHVRTAAAALARFSARNFAGPLLSASILWNRERLPALNADLLGDEEARGTPWQP